jgi:hypothetical protein
MANAPAQNTGKFYAVTPHDANILPGRPIGLYVGGAGDVTMVGTDGVAVLFAAVPGGTILPCSPVRVNDTGTDATGIVALY